MVFPNVHGMLTTYRLEDSICSVLTDLYSKHGTTMDCADSYHSKRQVPSCLVGEKVMCMHFCAGHSMSQANRNGKEFLVKLNVG